MTLLRHKADHVTSLLPARALVSLVGKAMSVPWHTGPAGSGACYSLPSPLAVARVQWARSHAGAFILAIPSA